MNFKQKIANNHLSFGSWITLDHTAIAEIMVNAGFDWLVVDMEHSAITLDKAQQLIQVISLAGIIPLVRVSENDACLIKRVMDAGAHGVIVPMVNTAADAEKAIAAVRYPPHGTRGVGLARAQGYGFQFENYKQWLQAESVVIAQIEHIEGIKNLEKILAVQGIDATLIGPYDLSGSLGRPGEFEHPEVLAALTKYETTNTRYKKTMGVHVIPPSTSEVEEKVAKGYRLIAWSLDTMFLGQICKQGLAALRRDLTVPV